MSGARPLTRAPWNAPPSTGVNPPNDLLTSEAKLEHLSALFVEQGRGRFSEQLSTTLALEIVLNEIVEQACLSTGATGAAIALLRDGEMVCRASSGTSAPELGMRLDRESGLSGECIQTRRVQRCDDAQSDPQANAEACRALGVRSAMLMPLLLKNEVVGIFEIFSARPAAFGERDQRTMEALAHGITQSLERAEKPLNRLDTPETVPVPALAGFESVPDSRSSETGELTSKAHARGATDFITWALGLTVVLCAVFLGLRSFERFGWLPATASKHSLPATAAAAGEKKFQGEDAAQKTAGLGSAEVTTKAGAGAAMIASAATNSNASATSKPESEESGGASGGLRIYQNGQEVFLMSPGEDPSSGKPAGSQVPGSPSTSSHRAVELSPSAAEGSVIYRVEPEYPEEARSRNIEGQVVLNLHIDREGRVQEAKLVSGDPVLGKSAIEAVKQWRFKPHRVDNQTVEVDTAVRLTFKMQR